MSGKKSALSKGSLSIRKRSKKLSAPGRKKVLKKSAPKTKNEKDKVIFKKPVMGLNSYLAKSAKYKSVKRKKSAILTKTNKKLLSLMPRHFHPGSLYAFWKRHPKSLFATMVAVTAFGSLTYIYVLKDLPNPYELKNTKPPMTTIIRARNGVVLYRVYNQANRVELPFNELPDIVKNSTIAIEDANFYRHWGVDIKAVARAFLNNLKQEDQGFYQGASTIPQQLIKNRLLTSEKSYQRKAKELVLSLWTEAIYSKEDILTMYLNTVGYGGPAYGIEAASQMYFNKNAKQLTLAEAAFLAGLPAAPTTFSPYGSNPKLGYLRQQQVLERMLKLGMIDENQYLEAVNEKLAIAQQKINILAPHFVMYVKEELAKRFGEKAVEEGGFDVTTTLDINIQNKAQEIVSNNIDSIRKTYRINNASALVTDPKKGEILAMVGSVDFFDDNNSGHYNAAIASRQPGSSFKPITYAYAFDHGFTPSTSLLDAPVIYKTPGSKEVYAPVNYDGKFHGNVTVRSALANSYNIPAVKTLEKFGVDNVKKLGIEMGMKSLEQAPQVGLSLTLGGAEVTMLDMARAYGTIANYGIPKDLKPILSIKDVTQKDLTSDFYKDQNIALAPEVQAEDNVLDEKSETHVISPLSAWWLIDILSDNVARMPAFGNYSKLSIPGKKVAVKTGTSNNFRDNWTIGFSPDYLTAVWVGNNDGSFMNRNLVSGITGAAPIWHDIMDYLLKDAEAKEFPVPDGLVAVKVCAVNGLLTCSGCPQEKVEYFTADKIPTKHCSFRPKAECDAVRAQAVAENKSEDERKTLLGGCAFVN